MLNGSVVGVSGPCLDIAATAHDGSPVKEIGRADESLLKPAAVIRSRWELLTVCLATADQMARRTAAALWPMNVRFTEIAVRLASF
jgi:hypothetical protein